MKSGESALARNDVALARKQFEAAGQIAHAPDAELGLVRALMQAGDYGAALSFGAHTAGAHRDEPMGALLYAWLLSLGGQDAVAERLLGVSDKSEAANARALVQALKAGTALRGSHWYAAPARFAPYASGDLPPAHARLTGTGVLMGKGHYAAAPALALPKQGLIWIRNGLGQTVAADVVRRDTTSGLVLLRLKSSLPEGAALAMREPFPGSPGYWVGYGPSAVSLPSWPRLRAGFHGSVRADGLEPGELQVQIPKAALIGGAVLDAHGQLAGVTLQNGVTAAKWTGLAALQGLWRAADAVEPTKEPVSSQGPRVTVEAAYAAGLLTSLQIMVADRN